MAEVSPDDAYPEIVPSLQPEKPQMESSDLQADSAKSSRFAKSGTSLRIRGARFICCATVADA